MPVDLTTATNRLALVELVLFDDRDPLAEPRRKGYADDASVAPQVVYVAAEDYGYYLVAKISISDAAGTVDVVDLSGASAQHLELIDPAGKSGELTLANRGAGTDGLCQAEIDTQDLRTPKGLWSARVRLKFSNSTVRSRWFTIAVV